MSQADVANYLKVSIQLVSTVERGAATLPRDKYNAVAELFGKEVFELRFFERLTRETKGAVLSDEKEFVQDFWNDISSTSGTVFVISGKSLPFNSRAVAEHGRTFLDQNSNNRIIFLHLDRYDHVDAITKTSKKLTTEDKSLLLDAWQLTDLQDIRQVERDLTDGVVGRRAKLKFFCLRSDLLFEQSNETALVLLKCLPLFHPLSVTMMFQSTEPQMSSGYLFIRADDRTESERHFAWFRLSDTFLKNLGVLIAALQKSGLELAALEEEKLFPA